MENTIIFRQDKKKNKLSYSLKIKQIFTDHLSIETFPDQ